MKLSEILRLVWINIFENKFKMMLTSLGIIVGAATIVIVIAIGKGGQADVADQFKNLNAGSISVTATASQDLEAEMPGFGEGGPPGGGAGGGGGMDISSIRQRIAQGGNSGFGFGGQGGAGGFSTRSSSRQSTVTLTATDVSDIKTYVPGLKDVTIFQNGTTTVFGGSLEEEETDTVVGAYPDYQGVSNLSLLYGRFLDDDDITRKDYVCVIGYTLAKNIFTYAAYAYGDYLEIDGKNYEIVGVLESMGEVTSGISPDSAVFVPYTTAVKQIYGTTVKPQISAVAEDVSGVEQAISNIQAVLKENYPKGYFSVADAGTAMEAASSSANTLALLLLAVASIVFIVGGIGIMNVMFVSVKERTSEIGLLKAIGCANKGILLEFLLEANIISVIGGLIGVGVSFGLLPLVRLAGMRVEASAWGYVLALVFAVVTGTLFGFYPAWKASKLVPIEALNLE